MSLSAAIDGAPARHAGTGGDVALLHAINGLAGRHHALDVVMIAFAKYSPELLAVVLVVLWLTWRPRAQRDAFLAGAAALVALGLGQVIGMIFPRPRPYLVHHVALLVPHAPDTSFPSDHTTLAFAIAAALWYLDRRLGAALAAFGLVVAFARVYVGAHYPTDVLGGAVLGAVVAMGLMHAARRPALSDLLERFLAVLVSLRIAAPRRHNV